MEIGKLGPIHGSAREENSLNDTINSQSSTALYITEFTWMLYHVLLYFLPNQYIPCKQR